MSGLVPRGHANNTSQTTSQSNYFGIPHLRTIACIVVLAESMGVEDPMEVALTQCTENARAAMSRAGAYSRPMTPEEVGEYRDLADTVSDIRSGFVSPTLGNIRDHLVTVVIPEVRSEQESRRSHG